jgi:hypothetical protein
MEERKAYEPAALMLILAKLSANLMQFHMSQAIPTQAGQNKIHFNGTNVSLAL